MSSPNYVNIYLHKNLGFVNITLNMSNTNLLTTIDFWQKIALDGQLYPRELVDQIDTATSEVVDLVGSRRSGKSSILKLLIRKLNLGKNFLYINFEDPIFLQQNDPQVVEELVKTFEEYISKPVKFLFFDEIQNIKSWENAIRKLRDSDKYKIYVTGSSSKLLSGELATLLTGRHLSYQVQPLSFREFLNFHDQSVTSPSDAILKKMSIQRLFAEYLQTGGFPEVVVTKNRALIKQYYEDIVQKDIVKRYEIRDRDTIEKMGAFLLSNACQTLSLASVKKIYEISHLKARNYLEYFKEAFLVSELPQFSYSLKTQHKALKKIYAIDNGLIQAVAPNFSENRGWLLENAVYAHLCQKPGDVFYYKGDTGKEVDFVVAEKAAMQLFQVAWDLHNLKTRARELNSAVQAAKFFLVKEVSVLTFDQEEEEIIDDIKIAIKPTSLWMLE